jgi:hypothetical protein
MILCHAHAEAVVDAHRAGFPSKPPAGGQWAAFYIASLTRADTEALSAALLCPAGCLVVAQRLPGRDGLAVVDAGDDSIEPPVAGGSADQQSADEPPTPAPPPDDNAPDDGSKIAVLGDRRSRHGCD